MGKETEYRKFTAKEIKWLNRFQKVMSDAPKSLFMFVGAGITVFPTDENGQRYMTENGSVDGNANGTGIITKIQYDGGDY